jgi:acyl-homoserine lactone acylase PvdQ
MPVHIIEKLFPYHSSLLEYNTYVIKDEEMEKTKRKTIKISEKDIKYANVTKKTAPEAKTISEAVKKDMSLNLDDLNKETKVGSNNCVISGKLTKNGFPYICNDPHLLNSNPSFWFIINIKIGKEYHLIGATSPGIPGLFIGSNSHIAWGITNGMIDVSDLIRVERDGDSYILDGQKKELEKRTERFYFNTRKTEFVEMEFLDSQYGPILNQYTDSLYAVMERIPLTDLLESDKYFYILRSSFTDKDDLTLKAIVNLSMTKDFKAFRQTVKNISMPLNLVYADVIIINIRKQISDINLQVKFQ